eukprot:1287806-Pleurochrysis_carterae.AAC.1
MSIGGDLPWLLAFLGKKNMNFTEGFSAFCLCSITVMSEFHQKDHELCTAETATMLTHTFRGTAYKRLEHENFYAWHWAARMARMAGAK